MGCNYKHQAQPSCTRQIHKKESGESIPFRESVPSRRLGGGISKYLEGGEINGGGAEQNQTGDGCQQWEKISDWGKDWGTGILPMDLLSS